MTPTLGIFRQALQTPDLSLATLTEARAATGADGMPRLMRTTRFAEAEISWHGAHWLLFMPLSPAALAAVERTASQTARLNTELLTEYRILPDELRWVDASGVPRATSLILQRLPEGRTFDEALLTVPAERLAEALGELRDGLGKLGFSHNNLRPENLRWTGTRFVPLRYHDARFGTPGGDDAAFEALLERIRLSAGTETLSDAAASYTALPRFDGHRWVSHIFEGLVCVEDEGGYGFVDTENREVIPAPLRDRGLRPGREHRPRAPRRPLGAVRPPRAPADRIRGHRGRSLNGRHTRAEGFPPQHTEQQHKKRIQWKR